VGGGGEIKKQRLPRPQRTKKKKPPPPPPPPVKQPLSGRSSIMFHTKQKFTVYVGVHSFATMVISWSWLWDIKSCSQRVLTRLMFHDLNQRSVPFTLGSSGGSNWTIQSTSGISRPRAATSVHSNVPELALQNSKKVVVRFCCFCFP